MEDSYREGWERVQQQRAQALAEAGLTEADFAANCEALRNGKEYVKGEKSAGNEEEDDLPPLEVRFVFSFFMRV
jgi:hypothetical protein